MIVRSRSVVVLPLLLFLFASGGQAQVVEDPRLIVEVVYAGAWNPSHLLFFDPLSVDDILVLETPSGRVLRVQGGTLTNVVLDVNVNSADGHGLFGMDLHPDFASNGYAYVYYSESSTGGDSSSSVDVVGNRLYRYTWNGSSFDSPLLLLDLPADVGAFHHGGMVLFGPDDKLYTTIGDQHRRGTLQNISGGAGPDDTSVIFRLEDDGTAPVDNPFIGVPGYEKYYAYGVRNVFGLDFDPLTGVLWQTDNGDSIMDEINRVDPGANLGWFQIMGPDALDPQDVSDLVMVPGATYSDPEFSFVNSRGINAIEFYDSTVLGAQYENDVFVADVVFNNIYHFELDPTRQSLTNLPASLQDLVADDETEAAEVVFASGFSVPVDIDTGSDGNLYVLQWGGNGRILRIRRKALDFVTDDSQIDVVCDEASLATVTGRYQAYGTSSAAFVQVDFYLDVALEPANLLASYTDLNVTDGADIEHTFDFAWPDPLSHTVIMIVDATDAEVEDIETNNQAQQFELCGSVVAVPEAPHGENWSMRLLQNHPNPFNPSTVLRFELTTPERAQLVVYDLAGRAVASLVDADMPSGSHAVTWHGRDQDGRDVPSGVYLAVLRAGGIRETIRMVLLK